ncbi:MAG: hypothetical protein A2Y33_15515 [Spirochaetes bacterium GWF1_51_8]|nr:MAG: hypothetical protein A2Y33_15515 [Spirochaetes bacterium GWF1_51_8]
MKIKDLFIDPSKSMSEKDIADARAVMTQDSLIRMVWVIVILFILTVLPIIFLINSFSLGEWETIPAYFYYFCLYSFRMLIMAVFFIVALRSRKKDASGLPQRMLICIFTGYILFDGTVSGILMQLFDGGITTYVIAVMLVSALLYHPKKTISIMLPASFIFLFVGILLLQKNVRILYGQSVNGLFTISIAWVISRFVYNSRMRDLFSQFTITRQTKELEYCNSMLYERIEGHSSLLEQTNFRLDNELEKKLSWEEKTRRYQDELREIFQVSFFYIKTPMQKVLAYLDHLTKDEADFEPDRKSILLCRNEIHHAEHAALILLDNLGIGMTETPFSPVDLNYVMERILESNSHRLTEMGLSFKYSKLAVILGDKHQCFRLLQGLFDFCLTNPRVADAEAINLSCEFQPSRSYYTIDTGVISDPDKNLRLFSMGQALEEKEKSFNLAFCKKIVEHHGGEMTIGLNDKNGAVVEFYFPKS